LALHRLRQQGRDRQLIVTKKYGGKRPLTSSLVTLRSLAIRRGAASSGRPGDPLELSSRACEAAHENARSAAYQRNG
jgi:hypothetical protein